MALDPAILEARIDLRICELKMLAAQDGSELGASVRAGGVCQEPETRAASRRLPLDNDPDEV